MVGEPGAERPQPIRREPGAERRKPTLVLAHGAGAGASHPWMVRVAAGLEAHGIHVVTFDFPYRAAGKKVPDPGPVLEHALAEIWEAAGRQADGPMFAGGKSMGGRIASQAAARGLLTPAPAGLVFFGYPLHPPGRPAQRRDKHLPGVGAPMLFVQGTRDPFGSSDEMRDLVAGLRDATLELVEGGDHSLVVRRRSDAIDAAVRIAADWLNQTSQIASHK